MGWGFFAAASLIAALAIFYWRLGPIRRWLAQAARRTGLGSNRAKGILFLLTLLVWLGVWLTLREDYGGELDAVMDEVFGSGGEVDKLMDEMSGQDGEGGTEQ
jgi:hypothetical protein